MMEIQYRKLREADLDVFIQMRMEQLQEEGTTPTEDLAPPLRSYYERHMRDGTFVGWLAMDGGDIIATSGMSFVEKPPTYGCPNGRTGILSSMYTLGEHRRQGIAAALLDNVVREARAHGCGAVQVTAADMGVLLYTSYGFRKNENFMYYPL